MREIHEFNVSRAEKKFYKSIQGLTDIEIINFPTRQWY